jgi:hypothetical protein
MGRHSIPDPEDEGLEPEIPSYEPDLGAEQPGGQYPPPERRPDYDEPEPPTRQLPRYEDPEPDYRRQGYAPTERRDPTSYPEYSESGYGEPSHPGARYRDPEADRPDVPEADFGRPGYGRDWDDRSGAFAGDYDDDDDDVYTDDDAYADDAYADDAYADDAYTADDDYADDDRPTEAHSSPPPSGPAGPAHSGDWEGGEWTGSHRAVASGRRGVSIGVIAALVAVVVAVAAVISWRFFGDALSDRSDVAAARCVDGDLNVAVLADPSISPQIATLAEKYNGTADPVGDRCVKVDVKPAGSDQVVNGFSGTWPAELGDRPALWIPASGVSAARLEAATGAQTISDSRSLVTSPVLLAIRPQLRNALAQQSWSTLPRLQSTPNALDGLNLPGWGALKLALPRSGDSDASYLAAEAVAAASAPPGAPPSDGVAAVNTLLAGQPELPDDTSRAAMDALVKAPNPASAPVHAVVTTEQQLFQQGAELPNAKATLASWLPPGPTATADYPTVLLSGDWLSQEQVAAASEFARFMRKPEGLGELAKAGFRTDGGTPPASDVTTFAPVSAPLSVGDNAMRATLANALAAPAKSPAVTIMLDQSMPGTEGTNTRMGNVVNALIPRIGALPPTAAVGLWTFDGASGTSRVALGPLSEPVDGAPRTQTLTTALDTLSSTSGGAVSFTTLRLVYNEALAKYRPDQANSVLVITEGPHTDQSLDSAGLQAFIRDAFDPARPVAVNVIDFGPDSDQPAWEAVAETTGGSYQNLGTSTAPELSSAISQYLG